jgi:hypothetical protein
MVGKITANLENLYFWLNGDWRRIYELAMPKSHFINTILPQFLSAIKWIWTFFIHQFYLFNFTCQSQTEKIMIRKRLEIGTDAEDEESWKFAENKKI